MEVEGCHVAELWGLGWRVQFWFEAAGPRQLCSHLSGGMGSRHGIGGRAGGSSSGISRNCETLWDAPRANFVSAADCWTEPSTEPFCTV
eukprot:737089-Pelagomonas_calceolata.AAC.1